MMTRIEALKESIRHWQANAAATHPLSVQMGVGACALCSLYYRYNCRGCPIARAMDAIQCEGTPYESARTNFLLWRAADEDAREGCCFDRATDAAGYASTFRERAGEMLALLQDLLAAEGLRNGVSS